MAHRPVSLPSPKTVKQISQYLNPNIPIMVFLSALQRVTLLLCVRERERERERESHRERERESLFSSFVCLLCVCVCV